jgi:hypothetical protein
VDLLLQIQALWCQIALAATLHTRDCARSRQRA